ncbi:MAG: hypothetical protein Q8928_06885 [Bacteroidota bacterium]|nr:hypothetical protein [Bacteroidota bacterium]
MINNLSSELRALEHNFLALGLLFLFVNRPAYAQTKGVSVENIKESIDYNVDSLKREYSNNKKILSQYEVQTLLALSHYPELKDIRIEFKESNIKTTLACQPKWNFFLKKRANRTYRILINKSAKIKGVLYSEIPFDAQVGGMGHELAHIVDYSHRSTLGIFLFGIKYVFSIPGRSKVEKQVDRITIGHQLGHQLYNFCNFILNSSVSEKYKEYKRKVYYKPEELLPLINVQ